ncbi:MAG: Twin-arginine translocation pathway signal, partial [Burkholderiaceae bacterium]
MAIDRTRRLGLQGLGPAGISSCLLNGSASAQTSAGSSLRILVGFPPGGGTDVMARYIADKLRERIGQPVLVENRAGASGAIAIDALKKAPT